MDVHVNKESLRFLGWKTIAYAVKASGLVIRVQTTENNGPVYKNMISHLFTEATPVVEGLWQAQSEMWWKKRLHYYELRSKYQTLCGIWDWFHIISFGWHYVQKIAPNGRVKNMEPPDRLKARVIKLTAGQPSKHVHAAHLIYAPLHPVKKRSH